MKLELLTSSPALQALAWALVHSLWQGGVAVLLLVLVLPAAPRAGARLRYTAHLLVLGALLVWPAATGIWLYTRLAAAASLGEPGPGPPLPLTGMPAAEEGVLAWLTLHGPGVAKALGIVACLWAAGVIGLALWWAAAWAYTHRRVATGDGVAPAHWQTRLRSLQARLGIRAPVRLLESPQVSVPSVVGWCRPVVLVPVGLLPRMDARQAELLLLHELVHVRRRDYAVNLLQLAAEILLFFHPAVHWISCRARVEREHCCDDEVARLCGEPRSYARALAAVEELRRRRGALALAVTDGPLLQRVRRLVLPPPAPAPRWRTGLHASACVVAVLLLGGWCPVLLRTAERAAVAARPNAAAERVEVHAVDPAGAFTLTLVGGARPRRHARGGGGSRPPHRAAAGQRAPPRRLRRGDPRGARSPGRHHLATAPPAAKAGTRPRSASPLNPEVGRCSAHLRRNH